MNDRCEICGESMKGAEGARVYHMSCLMKVILPLDKRPKSDIIRENTEQAGALRCVDAET